MALLELEENELEALGELLGCLAEDCREQDAELADEYVTIYAKIGVAQMSLA